ncbi:MAG: hypothetical protein AB1941_21140 [Gemmatimonadota bacterium]
MKSRLPRLPLLLALPAVLLAGCGRGGAGGAAAADSAAAATDTTNRQALDGLSAQQVEAEASSMTPEQAEALGIVDSTIHVESLQSPDDSIIARGRPSPAPAPAAPAAPADTAAARP